MIYYKEKFFVQKLALQKNFLLPRLSLVPRHLKKSLLNTNERKILNFTTKKSIVLL